MDKSKNILLTMMLLLLALSGVAHAGDIAFPDEELPSETVMPAFDIPDAVANPIISFTKKFELEVDIGSVLDEAFYTGTNYSVEAFYFWSEVRGIGLKYASYLQGLSTYSSQFGSLPGGASASINLNDAPGPNQYIGAIYKQRAFYGKLNVSKTTVIPLSMAVLYEAGVIQYSSFNYPLVALGFNNQFYFNAHWSLVGNVKAIVHQALDPLTVNIHNNAPVPNASSFGTKTSLDEQIEVGLAYLF